LIFRVLPGLQAFAHYQPSWLRGDLAAGLSVAAVALPVGIAYSDLAGVPAVVGMYAAIFPLFAYALFGSSRQLMTGPDAATCIIVAASLAPMAGGDPERYMALMVTLTLITGVLYIVGGFGRLGFIANFLSQPILAGYLNGIALIIVAGQLPKLFGYSVEAEEFFPKLVEFASRLAETHLPTLLLGLAMLALLMLILRILPKLPAALVVVVAGISAVLLLNLDQQGVVVLGAVPSGLPSFHTSLFDFDVYKGIFRDAAGIALVSFTSGVLTAKSFARRNRYEIDANQELIAFGACNLASGFAQSFPVTGADSRTAVNNAMGGKTQLVGIVAAAVMLLVLLFLTAPLAYLPGAALAAVIMISAIHLFDMDALRELYQVSHREFLLSVGTTLGVLILGVLPGVLLAVALSLIWLLRVTSTPHTSSLGRVPNLKGFHALNDYPEAGTTEGLVLFRFDGNLVFFNADYFRERVRAAVAAAEGPVEWVVIDARPVNVVDVTGMQKFDELREELADRGIQLIIAGGKQMLGRYFNRGYADGRRERNASLNYPTLKSAIRAFETRNREATVSSDQM